MISFKTGVSTNNLELLIKKLINANTDKSKRILRKSIREEVLGMLNIVRTNPKISGGASLIISTSFDSISFGQYKVKVDAIENQKSINDIVIITNNSTFTLLSSISESFPNGIITS